MLRKWMMAAGMALVVGLAGCSNEPTHVLDGSSSSTMQESIEVMMEGLDSGDQEEVEMGMKLLLVEALHEFSEEMTGESGFNFFAIGMMIEAMGADDVIEEHFRNALDGKSLSELKSITSDDHYEQYREVAEMM